MKHLTTLAVCLSIWGAAAQATADGPDHFSVARLETGRMLEMFDKPGSGTRVSAIPAGTDGLPNRGCTETEEGAWCKTLYRGVEGWVRASALGEGSAPPPGQGSVWRIAEASPEKEIRNAWIAFDPEGRAWGSTGCNQFQGKVNVAGGAFTIAQPFASTRKACPEDLMRQENMIFEAFQAATGLRFDPGTGLLHLEGPEGGLLVLTPDTHRWP
ncbi:META domain-containing protein [Rhodovulum imhoffii]|uniref:META domain-containing protein n=1 Tax=Rhodovulum imhoffii TaxID=365340 RepID=A0A2T5BVM7_9RHOB|nr:META domain-containing protein [Rhodovulum imhoffii]MBK5932826.1 hypothetical protein [Rhodovulum imhoffii]PTN03605.1 META domain-containing protein [Rhodovulum imhoffii]